MASIPDILIESLAMTYMALHVLLQLVFFFLLSTQFCRKPSQAIFVTISISGLMEAIDGLLSLEPSVFTFFLDTITALSLPVLIYLRHHALVQLRPKLGSQPSPSPQPSPPSSPPGDHYTLFVLGSGGHTAEMLSMIDRSIRPFPATSPTTSINQKQIRRYVVSHGDTMSATKVHSLEANLRKRFQAINQDPGIYDVKFVSRARRVHQSWASTPISFLRSIADIVGALLSPPPSPSLPSPSSTPSITTNHPPSPSTSHSPSTSTSTSTLYPSVICTNGPATAFAVILVSHILRILKIIPQTHMHALYIESFAKVSTLSLTGKLLYRLNLADQFIVQWPKLKERYPRAVLGMYFSVRPGRKVVADVS